MAIDVLNFDVEQVEELNFDVQIHRSELLSEVFMTIEQQFEAEVCFEVLHEGDITTALPVKEVVV